METEINGVRVVFRDKFPARLGWGLLSAVQRIEAKRQESILDEEDDWADTLFAAILDILTFEEVTQLIRGAVSEWDFDGDLDTEQACENLNPINELMPLATNSLLLLYTEKISGEVVGPPIPVSED